MAENTQKYIFGLADITWGTDALPVLGDAAKLTITPEYIDINSYEMGSIVDKIVKSYQVTVEVVFEEETAKIIQMAIPTTADANGNLCDSALGESLRAKAKELLIHPRSAGDSKEFDITIFTAVSTGNYERSYGLEQGKVVCTFTGLVKDGAVPGKLGNIFQIGAKTTV